MFRSLTSVWQVCCPKRVSPNTDTRTWLLVLLPPPKTYLFEVGTVCNCLSQWTRQGICSHLGKLASFRCTRLWVIHWCDLFYKPINPARKIAGGAVMVTQCMSSLMPSIIPSSSLVAVKNSRTGPCHHSFYNSKYQTRLMASAIVVMICLV